MIDFNEKLRLFRIYNEQAKREDCVHGRIDSTNAPYGEYTYRCINRNSERYGIQCRGCKYYSQSICGQ